MKLTDIVNQLDLEVKSGRELLDREVSGGYVSDILSDVLTHGSPGNIWITRQIHLNIIPIASAQDLAGIIIVKSRKPDENTLEKAAAERMPVLSTTMNAFQLVGKLHRMGLRGNDEND